MKKCIIYVSYHHNNTKSIVDSISEADKDLVVINGLDEINSLDEFDLIGFASGVSFGKMYPQLLKILETKLPENKKIFFICTSGTNNKKYLNESILLANKKNSIILGSYTSKGFDTYGIFKYIGGISKKHPNGKDKQRAVEFYNNIISNL